MLRIYDYKFDLFLSMTLIYHGVDFLFILTVFNCLSKASSTNMLKVCTYIVTVYVLANYIILYKLSEAIACALSVHVASLVVQ